LGLQGEKQRRKAYLNTFITQIVKEMCNKSRQKAFLIKLKYVIVQKKTFNVNDVLIIFVKFALIIETT